MNIVVVIQARTGSTRLPGKVLAPVCGRPLLEHMLERVRLAREPSAVVVATTVDAQDDAIERLCHALDVPVYRGHPLDCLDRHLRAAELYGADAVVKIPSDCPLIDPAAIDRVVARYRAAAGAYDYVSNLHPPSWPDGNDVEVISVAALRQAARETRDPFDLEHTTPFIVDRPERFRLANVAWEAGCDLSQRFRCVVDWREDLDAVERIFEALLPEHGAHFGVDAIVELYCKRPELEAINAARRGYQPLRTPAHTAQSTQP